MLGVLSICSDDKGGRNLQIQRNIKVPVFNRILKSKMTIVCGGGIDNS